MRVFIFGIGGTGSRVLRSLTMLLASGVKLDHPDLTIVPIIIDTDAHNGDTARTRDLLRSYYTIRKTFADPNASSRSDSFFNTQIRSFNRLDTTTSDAADLDVQFNFQNQDDTFANFIHFNALKQVDKDLIELLYSDNLDGHPELHLNLNVGFKGNPNIGSVVFNDLKNSPQFKNLESSYTQQDRVFIISSIFGGTGASGFPTLVKLIRDSTSNANLAKTRIGAITVMPYFNVDALEKSAINSAIFDTKTKAALAFYAEDEKIKTVNSLYYIADPNQSGTLPNVEGGAGQLNNSHLVELISATAILDFIRKKDDELSSPQCFEFGAESGDNPFGIAHFSNDTKQQYIRPLTALAYAAKIATDLIPELSNNAFYGPKELNIAGMLDVPSEYRKIIDFFEQFKNWSGTEMSSKDNGRAFNSFYFGPDKDLNQLVHGKPIKTSFLSSGLSKNKVGGLLTKIEVAEPNDLRIPEKYLNMLYKTAQACLVELGPLP
ncbi:hypothetical protein BEL04_08415 [Mucilaginibacter sp. PPCGB 2223]|uniref:hypothetical protein n=1 Tax=Mucilaginibacter sp. PPCGB 2223 TaxID=1886027 RepID=UPI00082697EB|nr:hypothetical protein [Mucilaginibacter sp. PPCGB 2223]OCX54271.1 hypothetical protein BEL04_08415 [Mucilaginibacter sp. PPCGB 2223]